MDTQRKRDTASEVGPPSFYGSLLVAHEAQKKFDFTGIKFPGSCACALEISSGRAANSQFSPLLTSTVIKSHLIAGLF